MGVIEKLKNKRNDVVGELIRYSVGLKVLYVEDDDALRRNSSIFLHDIFDEVDEASNGVQGLSLYKSKKYDIVITDLSMPGDIDGFELIKAIRKENSEQAVVVTTAHEESKVFLEAIVLGVDGFLLKPMNFTIFITTLTKISKNVVAIKEKTVRDSLLRENLELSRKRVSELSSLLSKRGETDSLTGLFTRKTLDADIFDYRLNKKNGTAFLIDIDKLTHINRIYGMDYGDELLQLVAKNLTYINEHMELYGNIKLYRLESDKFIALILDPSDEKEKVVIDFIENLTKISFKLKDSVIVNIKLFISIVENIQLEDNLILKLISGIVERKANRKDGISYIYYDDKSQFLRKQRENILWMHRIQHVIRERDVYPIFQPIVDNKTLKVVKYESLMRIKYNGEIISPAKFIEPATILGLLPELTKILIDKAFEKLQNSDISFSINISEEDINENYLKDFINIKLSQYNINPKRITFEVLEQMTNGGHKVFEHLRFFKDIGVNITIDDSGSEKYNFSRISTVDVHTIKIDGQFIKDLDTNEQNRKIVQAIVYLAKELNCQVVAEFVHNREIFEFVRDLDIEYSQGYYFGAPTFEPEQ
jgi:EAL domain-containing protein (putative c-di-GMP-specific phosphodiesterase class I)/PleD family two-component response regulator